MLLTELFKTEDRQECLELINTLHSELKRLGLKWDNPKELMEGLGKLGKFSERDMEDHFCLNFCEDYQRQVKVKGGRVDVVDKTNKVIWELKLSIPSRREAIKVYAQVLDYQLNKRFKGYELGVVAKSISPSAKTYLEDKGVRVLVYPDYKFDFKEGNHLKFIEEVLDYGIDDTKPLNQQVALNKADLDNLITLWVRKEGIPKTRFNLKLFRKDVEKQLGLNYKTVKVKGSTKKGYLGLSVRQEPDLP